MILTEFSGFYVGEFGGGYAWLAPPRYLFVLRPVVQFKEMQVYI